MMFEKMLERVINLDSENEYKKVKNIIENDSKKTNLKIFYTADIGPHVAF